MRTLVLALSLLILTPVVEAQEVDLLVYSTADGGGALTLGVDQIDPVVVTPRLPFCPGGICPYSSINPGFLTPAADAPGGGRFALARGTRISLVLVGIDDAASVKVGATILDVPGETVVLGTAPDVHVHPEWQLQAPQGVVGDYAVTFRLATAGAYAESAEYTVMLTNRAGGAPTATPTPTAVPATATASPSATSEPTLTATPIASATVAPSVSPIEPTVTATADSEPSPTATTSPPACAGDCNGDGAVAVNELIAGVNMALGTTSLDGCRSFDGDGDGRIGVPELIQAVNRALSGC